jgi:uncharacterized protein DUF5676
MTQTHPMAADEAHIEREAGAIPIVTFGLALSSFFALFYLICIFGYLALPGLPIKHDALAIFLPGFSLLSWRTFFLGLVESILWGWYIALVFGWFYNFYLRRAR